MNAVMEALRDKRKPHRWIIEKTPRYSHASLGYAEQGNKAVEGQVRTLNASTKRNLRELEATEQKMAWMIRHAGWTITRFRVMQNGRTSYRMLKGRPYRGEVLELFEAVWAKDPSLRMRC